MTMKIYVANLGKYNEGELVGKWINLPIDMDEEWEGIKQSIGIDGEQYEEWAIHEYECEFMKIGEYDNIEELNEIAETLEGLDEHDEEKLKALIEWGYYNNNKEAIENVDDFNLNEDINSDYDLGYYYMVEAGCYEIPEHLENYIDYEAFGRDIRYDGNGYFSEFGWIEKC